MCSSDLDAAKLALKKKVTKLRNYGKILNFGLGGGMGAVRLRAHFKKNGVLITEAEAQEYRDAWFQAWTEMREYHRIIGAELNDIDDKGREVGSVQFTFTGGANLLVHGKEAHVTLSPVGFTRFEAFDAASFPNLADVPAEFKKIGRAHV